MKYSKQPKGQKPLPGVCPAGVRDDIPRRQSLPCPDEGSLEEARRWQQEHIQ